MSEAQKDFVLVPNYDDGKYFRLTDGNHIVDDHGNIFMNNVRIFHLNYESPWTNVYYPASPSALDAIYSWCNRGVDGLFFAEYGNPQLPEEHSEKLKRLMTLDDSRCVARFSKTRVVNELNGQHVAPGAWVVADVVFPALAQGSDGYLIAYMKAGGPFRFSQRSTAESRYGYESKRHMLINTLATFDIITKEMDDKDIAEEARIKAERAERNERESAECGASELIEEPADEADPNPKAELHPKTQALMRRALPAGYDEKAPCDVDTSKEAYLEKPASE
jgi:hypothetical protein